MKRGLPYYFDSEFNPYRKASDEEGNPKFGFDFKGFMKRPDDMRLPPQTLESLARWKPKHIEEHRKFGLPLAKNFTRYLLSASKGKLHKADYVETGTSRKWNIYLDDEYLGIYTIFTLAGTSKHPRTYEGKIPDYPFATTDRDQWQDVLLEYAPDDDIQGDCRIDVYVDIPFP